MFSHGLVIGRDHRLRGHNGQDAAFWRQPGPEMGVGIVLDGCGSKHRDGCGLHPSRNEVGALLLGQFLADFLASRLPWLRAHNIDETLTEMHQHSCLFLHQLLAQYTFVDSDSRERFIMTRLLCTVVGFVILPDTAVCFWRGDGALLMDETILLLDEGNQPDYLAYNLISDQPTATCFHALQLLRRPARLAAATDGWQPEQLRALPRTSSSLALQRLMNQQARERHLFHDDGAIVQFVAGREQ